MIANIAEYGRESGYTLAHYKRALDRFVSHFDPSLRPITEKMGANEMATFLSNLTLPDSEFEVFEQQIHKLVRLPGQKIKAVMSTLHALAQSLYKGLEPTKAKALTDWVMVIGLSSMTIGETAGRGNRPAATAPSSRRLGCTEPLWVGKRLIRPRYFVR
jgi:hypothetical protein